MEVGVVVDADPRRDFSCVRDRPEHEVRRERRRIVIDDQIKAADFGSERLRDADRHRHNCSVLGARWGIDCDEVSGILDYPNAKDRMPEIGPAGHVLSLSRLGAGRSAECENNQQEDGH